VAVIVKIFGVMEGALDPHVLIGIAGCTFTDKYLCVKSQISLSNCQEVFEFMEGKFKITLKEYN
jgi:hypothetical protein